MERVRRAEKDDPVIHLISGGGSALAVSPLKGSSGAREKTLLHRLLLESGLGNHDINVVRKHFSAIKGGRLLLCNPGARHLSLILSDVPGGFPEVVAGGPTPPDPSTREECQQILKDSKISGELPAMIQRRLERREIPETPRPEDPRFQMHPWAVLASGEDLVDTSAALARRMEYRVHRVSGAIEEPVEQAADHLLLERDRMLAKGAGPFCIVAGGEARVRAGGWRGRGGRAQYMAAAAAIRLRGIPGCLLLAADSDGMHGDSPAAGAVADGNTHARARRRGLSVSTLRREGNSFRLFNALNDSVVTGPTGNNLRDLYLLLQIPAGRRAFRLTRGDRQGWRGRGRC